MKSKHIAALVASAHPDYSVEQIRQALRKGSDDILASGFDQESGYGRLNAYKAVTLAAPLAVRISRPGPQYISDATPLEITGTVSGPALASWILDYGSGTAPEDAHAAARGTSVSSSTRLVRAVTRAAAPLTFTVEAVNESGERLPTAIAGERPLTVERLVQCNAERELIRGRAHRAAVELLGGHGHGTGMKSSMRKRPSVPSSTRRSRSGCGGSPRP